MVKDDDGKKKKKIRMRRQGRRRKIEETIKRSYERKWNDRKWMKKVKKEREFK